MLFSKERGDNLIDWEIIKNEYLTTDTSYRKLAKKYNVNQATISTRAKKENWVGLKQAFNEQRQAEMNNAKKEADIQAFKDLLSIDTRLISLINDKLNYFEKLVQDGGVSAIQVKDLKGLVVSVSDLTDNLRSLNRIPSQSEEYAQKIAKERLEIERSKADISADTGDITIRYEGNVDELEEYGG